MSLLIKRDDQEPTRGSLIKRENQEPTRGSLIKRENQEPINFGLLDAAANALPPIWNGPHVGLRITEGFVTFRAMPLGDKGGAASAWPPYMYEFDDLLAQQKQGELERTMATQNRTRVSPSMRDITRAIEVSYWPMKYLGEAQPQLCEAVNAVALAHALDRDAGWVTRKRGGYADTWRARHDQGCEIIARRLIKDRVWVF